MVGFDSGVSPPGGMSYAAPLMNFANFSNWAADDPYQKIFNEQQQKLNQQRIAAGQQGLDIAGTFRGGLPVDPQTGQPDYGRIAAMLAQKGDINALTQLAPLLQQQQAGNTPLFPAAPGGQGGGAAPASIPARPLPPPAQNSPQGDAGQGTIASMVTDRLPQQDAVTGQTIGKVAQLLGVDPNAVLTPGQQRRAKVLIDRYAPGDGSTEAPSTFASRFAAADGSGAPSLPPSANAVSPRPQAQQPQGAPAAPAGQAPQQQAQGPIVPQVPLPPGFNDPQQAAMALRQRAAQIEAANPRTKPKADELRAWADRIEASIAPLSVGAQTTLVDPRTGKTLYQGPAAAAYGNAGGEAGATLDADANQYRLTGKLPPNMGRGIQGQQQATAIRTRAAEQEIAEGGDVNQWPTRWQKFQAQATGRRALENRAAGLELAENEATTLIPRVREASARVSRTEYPDINSLINAAKKKTGGKDVIKLGIAIESLVPVYARVLKPVGQIGVTDTNRAHELLDKAWSDGQIGAALDQMEVELGSARTALDKTLEEYGIPGAKRNAGGASKTKPDAEGWVTLPNGARIREKKAGE